MENTLNNNSNNGLNNSQMGGERGSSNDATKSVSVVPNFEHVMQLNTFGNPNNIIEYYLGRWRHARTSAHMVEQQRELLVAYPEPRDRLRNELQSCQRLGTTPDGKKIYLYDYRFNSSVMRELGRLRALTFKVVGEGTKQQRDIDAFDKIYRHIVLWDDQAQEIVGAYRIGEAFNYHQNTSASMLYTERLFNYRPKFKSLFGQSIELGRSFIQPKYWSKRGLDYLWLGIGAYLTQHPIVRYMFGAVSISNEFPALAQQQIVACYKHFFQPSDYQKLATPKMPFKVDRGTLESFQGQSFAEALLTLKQSLKHQNVTLPTLYKHYADLCDEGGIAFIDFNIDPDFSYCVDGLMLVDLKYIKDKKRRRYLDVHAQATQ